LSQAFVAQIQESVQPADALQGLLLDGIAAGYLRKQLMLEAEAAGRETMKQNKLEQLSSYGAEEKRRIVVAFSLPLENFSYGKAARYEALLPGSPPRFDSAAATEEGGSRCTSCERPKATEVQPRANRR
jgi:hypothetical protein